MIDDILRMQDVLNELSAVSNVLIENEWLEDNILSVMYMYKENFSKK